jgi:NAD(P)-dependent dehydrogenase (short-subunit alcohol dehydrogenase family)
VFAQLGLTRVTAAEAARKGVRVNALCPGPVTETVMSKKLGATLAKKMGVSPKKQLQRFLNTLLQGRAQTADEIAKACSYAPSNPAPSPASPSMSTAALPFSDRRKRRTHVH